MNLTVKILDWDKYNPRTDSKNHTWFRFENSFFIKTFSWTSEEQRLFQYLCCACSQIKKLEFVFDIELASVLLKRKKEQIINDLESLRIKEIVTISNSKLLQVTQSQLVPTYERTIRTIRTNNIAQNEFEREILLLYEKYPRKKGKALGLKKLLVKIKTVEDLVNLEKAVSNYIKNCKDEGRETKFIKYWSSFVNEWEDWIELSDSNYKQAQDDFSPEYYKRMKEKHGSV